MRLADPVSWCVLLLCCVVLGCGGDEEAPTPEESPPATTGQESDEGLPEGFPPPPADRPAMTQEDCQAAGGTLVGDIGNGAIHRPDYRCPDGQEPVGTVPLGVEGSVCCPAAAP